jgi:hypothetical protein
MNLSPPFAQRWLIYGLYAVFCQMTAIFLFLILQLPVTSFAVLRHFYAPWLEYPLCSLLLTVGGAVLFTYVDQHQ